MSTAIEQPIFAWPDPAKIADLTERLRLRDLALGNDEDKVRTEGDRAEFFRAKTENALTRTGLLNTSVPDKWDVKLEGLEAALPKMQAAKARLEYLLNGQPDWRQLEGHENDAQYQKTVGLIASLRAVERGVEYFEGVPAVPVPLRDLLGVIQLPDGRQWPNWYGSLPALEKTIADVRSRVEARRAELARHLATAMRLLAE